MGRPKGSKNKPKVNKETVADVRSILETLPVKEETSGLNFTPDIEIRRSDTDTKPTPNHEYYQFIHPCNVEKAKYDYRFLGIVRNGQSYSSLPFGEKEECHKLLKRLIEDSDIPSDPMLVKN